MLHPLEHVRDHQNPLADTPALVPCQAPQLCRPRFAAKKVCCHRPSPPNMVRLPNHSTTSGNPRKPVLVLSAARIFARDKALAGSASQAMLTEAPRRLAAAIQAGDH